MPFYICIFDESGYSFNRLLERARQAGANVIAAPISGGGVSPRTVVLAPAFGEGHEPPHSYSDLLLSSVDWTNKIILCVNDDWDCDSSDDAIRKYSTRGLAQELARAEHLQCQGYVMLRLSSMNHMNLARTIKQTIKGGLLVRVPVFNKELAHAVWRRDIDEQKLHEIEQNLDSWQWWNAFRWHTNFNHRIKVVLEFNENELPSMEVIRRWLGEPVEAVMITASMFVRNRHNYPVLPKAWQNALAPFIANRINVIVGAGFYEPLKDCIDYLKAFHGQYRDTNELHTYEDVVEIPLQPLSDNLDSATYEIFEKDRVKYKLYQDAIGEALKDRVPMAEIEDKLTIVMVLGAGRGPLVRATLNAAQITGRKIRVYIIEKNPNAIDTLRAITKKLWSDKDIHLFAKDMRQFAPPERADILVSELLGSFGDNELSPECLDCAQKLLKPDGISIPSKSVSFINPVMSQKLHNTIDAMRRGYERDYCNSGQHGHHESGFVTMLKNIYNIAMPQALFEFVHPNYEEPIDNNRYKLLQFEATLDCVLTGIGGYFESVLYKNIVLSINPPTHTRGMDSWFAMYFPILEPLPIKKGDIIEVHFWRKATHQKVWYEWAIHGPHYTRIFNQDGLRCPIYCN